MHSFRSSRQAGGKRPPCVATPTTATVGSNGERVVDRPDDRDALVRSPPPAAESRIATTGSGP